jgi:hypothetical protein
MEQKYDIDIKYELPLEESKHNELVSISGLEGKQSLVKEQIYDIDIKYELPLEESKHKELANISGLQVKQSLIMELKYDIDIKYELPLEESKPLIKHLVAFAPFTPQLHDFTYRPAFIYPAKSKWLTR